MTKGFDEITSTDMSVCFNYNQWNFLTAFIQVALKDFIEHWRPAMKPTSLTCGYASNEAIIQAIFKAIMQIKSFQKVFSEYLLVYKLQLPTNQN